MEVKSVRELAFLFVDNEMEQDMLIAFQARIETCPECAREARYARHLTSLVRERCARQPAPRKLRRRIHSLLLHLPQRPNPRPRSSQ